MFSSFLEWLYFKVTEHASDTSRVADSVILSDEAGRTPLDVFRLVDVSLLVGVPDYSTVFRGTADEGNIGPFPTVAGMELKVSA